MVKEKSARAVTGAVLAFALVGCGAPSGISREEAAERAANPFYRPNICVKIRKESPSMDVVVQHAKDYANWDDVYSTDSAIYQLKNGNFVHAFTIPEVGTDRHRRAVSWAERDRGNMARIAKRRPEQMKPGQSKSMRCSDGSDIARDTGIRIAKKGKPSSGGGLIGLAITGLASALENAANAPSPAAVTVQTPPTAQPAPVAQTGVQRDSDGWVSLDGKTLGRIGFSYGEYRITCSKGYNAGWGSNSAFGGSFTVDVADRDAATAVLLQACKR